MPITSTRCSLSPHSATQLSVRTPSHPQVPLSKKAQIAAEGDVNKLPADAHEAQVQLMPSAYHLLQHIDAASRS